MRFAWSILIAAITALVLGACSTSTVPYPTLNVQPKPADVTARCIELGRIDNSMHELAGAKPLPSDAPLRTVIAADDMAGTYPVYLYDALCANRQGFAPYGWLMDALPPSYDLTMVGFAAAVYPPSGKPDTWVRIRAINVPGVDAATLTHDVHTEHLLWCVVQTASEPGQQETCNAEDNPTETPIDAVGHGFVRLDCDGGPTTAASGCSDFVPSVGPYLSTYFLPADHTLFIMQSSDDALAREFAQLAVSNGGP